MNQIDKLVEDRIRAKGWIKLLPTDEYPTGQPHRFRYVENAGKWIDDLNGKSYLKDYEPSVSIIQYGELAGVYQGPNWQEKYKQVDWDTPNCCCDKCLLLDGSEIVEATGKSIASFVRQYEGLSSDETVNIAHLQIEQEDNGYKKVTFYYKADKDATTSAEM